jgi:hypothetical protein
LSFRFIAQAAEMKAVFQDATSGTIDKLGDAISRIEKRAGELKGQVLNEASQENLNKFVNQQEIPKPTDETREEVKKALKQKQQQQQKPPAKKPVRTRK